jgi:fructose-bisphosphate aldolase class II
MLVSAEQLLKDAAAGYYAVGQFNLNNLEWAKAVLETAEEMKAPVILGVTDAAAVYMGGYRAVAALVRAMEAEVGSVAGEEDGISGRGECADPEQCGKIADLGVTMLAAGIGNVHGVYPANWKGLDFSVLSAVKERTGSLPLVLHGGSGVPEEMMKKAISLGIAKINVNTECQIAFAQALHTYFAEGRDLEEKGYNLQKIMNWRRIW